MGARWYWHAICELGHLTSNFSGGPDGYCSWVEDPDDSAPCSRPLLQEVECPFPFDDGTVSGTCATHCYVILDRAYQHGVGACPACGRAYAAGVEVN